MNNKVDEYIKKQKSPQKQICQALREIILRTFPSIKEDLKYGVPYYDNDFYIVALKNHVNLGFSIEGLRKEEIELLEGTGKTTRHLKIFTVKDIDEDKIQKLLTMIKNKR